MENLFAAVFELLVHVLEIDWKNKMIAFIHIISNKINSVKIQ